MRGRTKSDHFMRTGKKELCTNVSIIRKKSWFEISRTINFSSFLFNWLVEIVKLCFVIGKCECFGPQYFGLWKLGSNFFIIQKNQVEMFSVATYVSSKVLLLLHHLKTYLDIWSKICLLFFMFCAHMIIEHSHLERNMVYKRPFEGWPHKTRPF